MKKSRINPYYIIDIFFIISFLILLSWSLIDFNMTRMYVYITFTFLGIAFIFSKKLKDVSLIEKALYWMSQYVAWPRTSINHIICGVFMLFIGFISLFVPFDINQSENIALWESLKNDPRFWILMMIVLLINVLYGIDQYNRSNKKGE
ncbi:MAG: hypothetical protein ACFFG0_57380 [Candidatus Thorarchaeota archaeon]